MRALVCRKLGDPTLPVGSEDAPLVVEDSREPPKLQSATSVRIKVVAASVNFADALMVMGKYQERPELPFVAGSEVAGSVLEVGSRVTAVRVGDRVAAVVTTGGYAEQVVVDQNAVFQVADGCDMAAAAGLPVAFGTSHVGLLHRANLQAGQAVLVLGAAGGVGVAAVQIAKKCGAIVIAAARGKEKADFLRSLGADEVIDTEALPLKDGLKKVLGARKLRGVDVLLDPVGGQQFKDSLRVVKWGGHVVVVGFASGAIPTIQANIALVKNLTVHGLYWGSYMTHRPAVLRDSLRQLFAWLADGSIRVPISHRHPLQEAHLAYKALLERRAMGKAIILVDSNAGGSSSPAQAGPKSRL